MRDITNADREIGRRIQAERKRRGLTTAHLARAVGVSPQQMQKYEIGDNRISANKLIVVADVLGVAVTDLLGVVSLDRNEPQLSSAGIKVGQAFDRLPTGPLKTALLEFILALAEADSDSPIARRPKL